MGRTTLFSYEGALRGQYAGRASVTGTTPDYDFANDHSLGWVSADGQTHLQGIKYDADDVLRIARQAVNPARVPVSFYLGAAGAVATKLIFVAPIAMAISSISEVHATAESTAAALSMQIFKDTGTQVPGGGGAVMSNSFDLKATASTVQYATMLTPGGDGMLNSGITLAAGDKLSIVITGTPHEIAAVTLTIWLSPGMKGFPVVYQNPSAGAGVVTQAIFQANRDCKVVSAMAAYSVKGLDAGAVTLDVTKDTGTNAPGAGTSLLAATISLKGTINTVNSLSPAAAAATLQLAAGNRIAVKITGTPTAVDGLVAVAWITAIDSAYYGQIDPTIFVSANGSLLAAQSFLIADRDYEIVDQSGLWSTAGSDGGAVTFDVGIIKGTTAPGSATAASTGAVSVKTTANTTAVLPVNTSRRLKLLSKGDRLVFILNGTLTALVGAGATVSLLPR